MHMETQAVYIGEKVRWLLHIYSTQNSKPGPESLVYTLPPADISTEALYFLYTAPEFSNLCDV
jgi:hypothetical protein